jgi:mycothione reductase
MKQYDVIVVGSGCGMNVVSEALEHDMDVALVDRGPLGGTCPNVGCIPSKMLIHTADRIMEATGVRKLGVAVGIESVDFSAIMERMRRSVAANQAHMRRGIKRATELDFYEGEGHFVADYTIEVNGERIRGSKIFIASGSRPLIPPINGLDQVEYLTNESLLQLKHCPESMIIVGGGYIAVEYGHFFAAMGSKVTMLEMADRLVMSEEPEISHLLEQELGHRMTVRTKTLVQEIRKTEDGVGVLVGDGAGSTQNRYTAKSVLIAAGRRSNADLLKVEDGGVELDKRGYVRVNEYLEASMKNVYAVGDANGQQMFTHVANREAMTAADCAVHGTRLKMDYSAAPHAVYSHPQIASVGLTEEAAKKEHKILVGRSDYYDVAQGEAMMERTGFAKAIVDADTEKILGFHIIGPYAPLLIQEVVDAMAASGDTSHIGRGMHIHPSITELIPRVFAVVA